MAALTNPTPPSSSLSFLGNYPSKKMARILAGMIWSSQNPTKTKSQAGFRLIRNAPFDSRPPWRPLAMRKGEDKVAEGGEV